ncbi:MarR family winged helix-turn-helix transcriptional regulator [Paenibacillus gorillae]|uniref:MarR family winged helix-turn-helix transcriptional regulator n=1 Tax=Paenibacillus gorillae TaxID=1243662 RepID=UPI0004B04BE9|nr:MarR family transcriptional regulator [Paenibacillus gorillae]
MKKEPLGKLISYVHRQNSKILTKALSPYGIGSGGQHSFLKTILISPGVTQDQLTQQLKFDKATTARSVKQLEQSGYIERRPDPNDRRSHLLYPTLKAEQFHPTLKKILQQTNENLASNLSSDEEEQLMLLLQKVSRQLAED